MNPMQGLNNPRSPTDRSIPDHIKSKPTTMGWSEPTFMQQAQQLAGNQQGFGRFAGLNSPYAKYLNPQMNQMQEHGGGQSLFGLQQSPAPQMPSGFPPMATPQGMSQQPMSQGMSAPRMGHGGMFSDADPQMLQQWVQLASLLGNK